MNEIAVILFLLAFLYVFYETNVVPHYLKLINDKFFKVTNFFDFQLKSPVWVNYFEFLCVGNKNFWFNLFACQTCLSVWLVVIANLACNLGWYRIGGEILVTWVGYALLKKVLKKLYE